LQAGKGLCHKILKKDDGMIKKITCTICTEKISIAVLFDHFVAQHNWTLIESQSIHPGGIVIVGPQQEMICPNCYIVVRNITRLQKHLNGRCPDLPSLRSNPQDQTVSDDKLTMDAVTVICPCCNSLLSKKNLQKHIENKCKKYRTLKDLAGANYTSTLIRLYLDENQGPDSMGKFGVPQDKYRNGTFGLHSMEYDGWSKECKKQ
jgi:phage FluMu protein Com